MRIFKTIKEAREWCLFNTHGNCSILVIHPKLNFPWNVYFDKQNECFFGEPRC